jgi:amidase
VGFRTTQGRVPVHGREDWLPGMGVTGPMGRSVADVAFLLSVQAGYDARAPLSLEGDGREFAGPLKGDVRGRRIGWLGDFGGAAVCEPQVLATCRAALKDFEALGCVVEDAAVAYPAEKAWQSFIRLRGWMQGGPLHELYDHPARRAQLKPEAIYEVEMGRSLSAFDLADHSIVRSEWAQAMRALFARYDYLVAPTAQLFAFDAAQHWPKTVAGREMRTYHEWMMGVCLVTMTGCPSLAVPAGFGAEGTPIGLQIIAPIRQEMAALRLGAAYEAVSNWTAKRPPALA